MEVLVCVSYAAGHTFLNAVERGMPSFQKMSGITRRIGAKTENEDRVTHLEALKDMADCLTFENAGNTYALPFC